MKNVNINLASAVKLSEAGALGEVQKVADAAFNVGVESTLKRVNAAIDAIEKEISKGGHNEASVRLRDLRNYSVFHQSSSEDEE